MTRLTFCLKLILILAKVHGQDLVINGSFEEYRKCPKATDKDPVRQLHRVKAVQGAPGFFHACSESMGTPVNWAGNQAPFDGKGYAGLVLTAHGGGECRAREFIQLELAEPLVNGAKYRLVFHVSLADRSGYYTDRIGACFTKEDRSRKGVTGLIGKPDIDNAMERFINDTSGWMRVEGAYSARGGERYLILGNFQGCHRTTRKAVTTNAGDGVLHNMKARNALDLDPDKDRALRRKKLATQAYVYLDGVELWAMEGFKSTPLLTAEAACATDHGAPPEGMDLIPDPNFDDNVPTSRAHWKNASGGTPDLLKGQAGIYLYSAVNQDHREFMYTELKDTLDPCGIYAFRMRIRRDPSYGYAVDRIGIALVDTFIVDRRRDILPYSTSWSSPPGFVMDGTETWTTLCGEFRAPGCSRALIMGNFSPDDSTMILQTKADGGPFAYYFVDEVSLWKVGNVDGCDLQCTPIAAYDDTEISLSKPFDRPIFVYFQIADHLPDGSIDPIAADLQQLLTGDPGLMLILTGHTDDTGTVQANEQLSRQRAETVRDALIRAGIDATRISVRFEGSRSPIAENSTESGRRSNRRVEIMLKKNE